MKFSIIIPAYNSEDYLEGAILSVLSQRYHDYELIIVNDGSTDGTETVIQKYLSSTNIKYIAKKNGGVSSARNVGIKAAIGDYILFLDSDDRWNTSLLETVVPYCDQYEMVCYNISELPKDGRCDSLDVSKNRVITINEETFQHDFFLGSLRRTIWYSPCNKIFKRAWIEKHHLYFDEELSVGEDMLFTYHYAKSCTRVLLLDCALYYYMSRPGAATKKKDFDYLSQYEKTYGKLEQFMQTEVLSAWGLDFSKEILVNSYYCGHGFRKFAERIHAFRESKIYTGLLRAHPSNINMKLYWILLREKCDLPLYLVIMHVLRKKEKHG